MWNVLFRFLTSQLPKNILFNSAAFSVREIIETTFFDVSVIALIYVIIVNQKETAGRYETYKYKYLKIIILSSSICLMNIKMQSVCN